MCLLEISLGINQLSYKTLSNNSKIGNQKFEPWTPPLKTLDRVVITKLFLNSSGKSLFMFICVANKPKLNISLGLTSKQTELKHNNVFVNKLATKLAQFNYI